MTSPHSMRSAAASSRTAISAATPRPALWVCRYPVDSADPLQRHPERLRLQKDVAHVDALGIIGVLGDRAQVVELALFGDVIDPDVAGQATHARTADQQAVVLAPDAGAVGCSAAFDLQLGEHAEAQQQRPDLLEASAATPTRSRASGVWG